jgi:hypothetical protein
MATGAAPQAAIHIYPSYTHIGPGLGIQLAVFRMLDHCAMAVETASGTLKITVHA